MTMYVRIDHNSKYKKKKKARRKIPLGYILLVDNKCKKSKRCEFSNEKEKNVSIDEKREVWKLINL